MPRLAALLLPASLWLTAGLIDSAPRGEPGVISNKRVVVQAPPPSAPDAEPLPAGARRRFGTGRFRLEYGTDTVCISPDGRTLAVADRYNVALYDTTSGQRKSTLATPGFSVYFAHALAFRDGGRKLVGADIASVRAWDVARGKEIASWIPDPVGYSPHPISFAADGNRFAVAYAGPKTAQPDPVIVRELNPGREVARVLPLHNNWRWVALSPDGKTLATGGDHENRKVETVAKAYRKTVQLWDVASGKERRQLKAACAMVRLGCFSPDGTGLVTVGASPLTVQFWEIPTGKQRWRVKPPWIADGMEYMAGFSADGKRVYAADGGGHLGLWDTATGKEISRHGRAVSGRVGVAFCPDGRALAWGQNEQILEVWDPLTGRTLTPAGVHGMAVRALAFSADGETLCSLGDDGRLGRWDVGSGKPGRRFGLQPHLSRGLLGGWVKGRAAFSPDGRHLAVPTAEHSLVAFDAATGRRRWTLSEGRRHQADSWEVAFSADGATFAAFPAGWGTVPQGGTLVPFWESVSGKEIRELKARFRAEAFTDFPYQRSMSGALSPDGKHAAVAMPWRAKDEQEYTELHGLDLATGKVLSRCDLPGGGPLSLAFAKDGRSVVIAGPNKELYVCDVLTGTRRHTIRGSWDHVTAGPVFSPDGRTLALATIRKGEWQVRVLEWASRAERLVFRAGHSDALALAFAPDGRTLASGHRDTTILLWDLTGKCGERCGVKEEAHELPPVGVLPPAFPHAAFSTRQVSTPCSPNPDRPTPFYHSRPRTGVTAADRGTLSCRRRAAAPSR